MTLPAGTDALSLYEAIRSKSAERWKIWDTVTVGETLHIADVAFYNKENDTVTVVRMLLADYQNIRVSLTFLSPPETDSFEQLQETSKWNIDKTAMFSGLYSTEILEAMFYSGAVEPSYDAKARVLQIGLGAGGVFNFTAASFPNIELTAVELSPVMLATAKKWFQLKTSDTQRCFVDDGVKFLEKAVEKGETFDAILVDATYCGFKDAGEDDLLAPVPPFREVSFFECAKRALTSTGCIVFNVVSAGGEEDTIVAANKFEESLRQVFSTTNNVVVDGCAAVLATNNTMPAKEEIKSRIDALNFRILKDPTGELDAIY